MRNVQTLMKSKQNNTISKLIRGGEQSTGGVGQRDWEVWRVVSGEQRRGGGSNNKHSIVITSPPRHRTSHSSIKKYRLLPLYYMWEHKTVYTLFTLLLLYLSLKQLVRVHKGFQKQILEQCQDKILIFQDR